MCSKLLITAEPSVVEQPTTAHHARHRDLEETAHVPHQSFVADARFVTLSATYGAGGSVVGPLLARRLALPFADRLLPARDKPVAPSGEGVMRRSGRRNRAARSSLGSRTSTWRLNFPAPRDPEDLRDHVRDRVEESIGRSQKAAAPCCSDGRARSCWPDHPGAFHVRLDGPPRTAGTPRRAVGGHSTSQAARARLIETDEARARYTRRLYQHDPADPTLYHVVLDVTVLSASACVELLAAAAEAFWDNDDARLEETMRETRASLEPPVRLTRGTSSMTTTLSEQMYERRWWTLGVLCLSLVVISVDNTILNVALPSIVQDLGAKGSAAPVDHRRVHDRVRRTAAHGRIARATGSVARRH